MLRIMAIIIASLSVLSALLITDTRRVRRRFLRRRRRGRGRGRTGYISIGDMETLRTTNPNITNSEPNEATPATNRRESDIASSENRELVNLIVNIRQNEDGMTLSQALGNYLTYLIYPLIVLSMVQPCLALFSLRDVPDGQHFVNLFIVS